MKIVMPIAGRGSRFKQAMSRNPEYNKPKPFIDIKGYPMIRWATGSLPFIHHRGQKIKCTLKVTDQDLIFIGLKEQEQEFGIREKLKEIYGQRIKVILISEVTRGAAETVLKARESINNNEPLLISDSDHFIDGQAIEEMIKKYPKIDGIIPVFHVPERDPKWSYSRTNRQGFVKEVAEKTPISEWANIGAYYYKRGRDFVWGAEEMIKNNELSNNEFYVAPVYNKLIQRGGKVILAYPKYVYGLGTPQDLEYFVKNTNYTLE